MANENLKQGDKPPLSTSCPQSTDQLMSFHLRDDSDTLTGIYNVEMEPVRYCLSGEDRLVPESYGLGIPFHAINGDVSLFPDTNQDYLNKPVSDFSVSIGNRKGFDLNHAFDDAADAANKWLNDLNSFQIERTIVDSGTDVATGLQTCRLGSEYNGDDNCWPWPIENQIAQADGAPVSIHKPTGARLAPSSSQMHGAGGEENDNNACMPWITRNQFIQGGSVSMPGHSSTSGELARRNSFVTGTAQSNHSEIKANFLSLGCGTNKETNSICNDPSRDSNQKTERVVSSTSNTFPDLARDSFHFSSSTATGFSTFHNIAGGFTRLAHENPFQEQKVDGFSSLGQIAAGFPPSPLQMQNVEPVLNVDRLSHQVQHRDIPYAELMNNGQFSQPSRIENGRTLSLSEEMQQYHHIPTSWNIGQGAKRTGGIATTYSNAGFQVFSTDLSMPYPSIGIPNAAWYRAIRPLSSSSMVWSTSQPTSVRLHNNIRAVNLSPGPFMTPSFVEIPGSMAWLGQSGPVTVPSHIGVPRSMVSHGQSGAVGVPSHGMLRSMSCQGKAAGDSVKASAVSAAQATEGSPFSKKIRVQPASKGIHDQPQASVVVKPSKRTPARANTADQDIPEAKSSSVHSGTYCKRDASIFPRNAPPAQRRKTRSPIPYSLSSPTLRQTPPPHAAPPSSNFLSPQPQLPQIIPSRTPLIQAAARLPSLPRKSSLLHIKWQDEDKPSPSGLQCPICKRDLSYTPEGPIFLPENLVPASVLPCGHYFHTSCLIRITPDDQAGDPPCIPCALEEKK